MHSTGIIELRRIGENDWRAKYQGNYGIYTIKISTDGKKTVKYSCSCPSDYYPCKHIPIIEKAVAEQLAANKGQEENYGRLEECVKKAPAEKLQEFIIAQAKYNPDLFNAVLLKFAAAEGGTRGNNYSALIKKALASVSYDEYEEDYYYPDEGQDIEALDEWLEKAWEYTEQGDYNEAILISKAFIEEYSQWLYEMYSDSSFLFSSEYQSIPFDILEEAANYTGKKELFDYCLAEIKKPKYSIDDIADNFHSLLESLAITVDPDAFILLQNELLAEIPDKSSRKAKKILERKIHFYKRTGQEEKAQSLIRENIQIESFCMDFVKSKINEKDYPEAKKFINAFIEGQKEYPGRGVSDTWYELLLDIAQKEKDLPAVKELAYRFIKNSFRKNYFEIYKAAFGTAEWAEEREKLISHYSNEKYFSDNAAELLAAESDTGRLIKYIEKYPIVQVLEKYLDVLSYDYPEKTLDLLTKAIIPYAEANTGRSHYEYIFSLLKKMSKIAGGKKAALELIMDFRMRYRNRRAMMEILGKFK